MSKKLRVNIIIRTLLARLANSIFLLRLFTTLLIHIQIWKLSTNLQHFDTSKWQDVTLILNSFLIFQYTYSCFFFGLTLTLCMKFVNFLKKKNLIYIMQNKNVISLFRAKKSTVKLFLLCYKA